MGAMDILNPISTGVGIVGGLSSLIFGQSQARKQARYQQRMQLQLMEKQQQYAKENAATDYARQRALITDNASLEKSGRQLAGLSTAGDFGKGSASVSPISAPSAPSAPNLPDPNQTLLNGLQMAQGSLKDLISNRYANAQAESLELDNEIKRKSLPELTAGSKGRGRSDWAAGQKATGTLQSDIKTAKATAISADNAAWASENEAAYASANAFANAQTAYNNMLSAKQAFELAKQQYKKGDLEYQLAQELYQYQVQEAQQTVANLRKTGRKIDVETNNAVKQGQVIDEQIFGQRLNNKYLRKTMASRIKSVDLDNLNKKLEAKLKEKNIRPKDFFEMASMRIQGLPEKVADYTPDDWVILAVDFAPALFDSLINVGSRVIPLAGGK